MRAKQVGRAVAQQLAAAGVGTWNPDGVFTAGQTAITLKQVPTNPDRVISVTVYNVNEDPDPRSVTQAWSVQVRTRAPGIPDEVDELADDVHEALECHHTQWPEGVFVQRAHRHNFAPLGPDGNRRHERVDNYRIITAR
ncbi:minor capsid protein [Cellulosimicrobium funkei]|uniref:minor capsid protein n=1 Tax=Cellulosimicrobium funkei TaxID=264251 RepID=UPI00341B758D